MVNAFTEIQKRNEESESDHTDNDSNDELSDSENEEIEEEFIRKNPFSYYDIDKLLDSIEKDAKHDPNCDDEDFKFSFE